MLIGLDFLYPLPVSLSRLGHSFIGIQILLRLAWAAIECAGIELGGSKRFRLERTSTTAATTSAR